MYSLVIGALALFALAILVFSMKMSDVTQGLYTSDSEEYRESVVERIEPFGQTFMPGDDVSVARPQVQEAPAAEPVAAAMSGPQVYNAACNVCHGTGVGGAPMLSDTDSWGTRIDQGTDTLYMHAIDGYTGEAGFMPAKGGRADLSDDEVRAAVDYMVDEAG